MCVLPRGQCVLEVGTTTEHIIIACTLLSRNKSFYRQITSHEKDGAVSGVGQWCGTATEYKIVVLGCTRCMVECTPIKPVTTSTT